MSGFPPELVYPAAIMKLPLTDLLVIRGAGGRRLAEIEVPAFGPCMGARAISSKGAGPWLMLLRPPDIEPPLAMLHPAFLPVDAVRCIPRAPMIRRFAAQAMRERNA